MTNRGFTIIELLIVIAIIGILTGVAVPYYNDYIYDARLATLKQNLATYRSVLNQFRGDHQRGPFAIAVYKDAGATALLVNPNSSDTNGSELISGPIQIINGTIVRSSNLKYLMAMPTFINPKDGSPIPVSDWNLTEPASYFYDSDNDGFFDIDDEFAFQNNDNDTTSYDPDFDIGLAHCPGANTAGTVKPLDYTSFSVTIDGVDY